MKRLSTKPLFPVCRQCRVTPLMHLGWIWECPRCGLRITTAAVRHDSGAGDEAVRHSGSRPQVRQDMRPDGDRRRRSADHPDDMLGRFMVEVH
jgi:hypothetical protein